jgi:hypothetical protein
MPLFHYTTKDRLTSITNQGVFRPSEDTQTDSVYGEGWYLTDLPPTTCEYLLMGKCWQRTTLFQRIRHFMEVEVIGAIPLLRRDNVHFVAKTNSVSFRILRQGAKPVCCFDRSKCPNRR